MANHTNRCPDCNAPLATQEQYDMHAKDCRCAECESVCWREYWHNECTRVGKGAQPHDWRAECERLRQEIRWHMAVDGLKGSQCWNARECLDSRERLFALVGAYPPAEVMPRIRAALAAQGVSHG